MGQRSGVGSPFATPARLPASLASPAWPGLASPGLAWPGLAPWRRRLEALLDDAVGATVELCVVRGGSRLLRRVQVPQRHGRRAATLRHALSRTASHRLAPPPGVAVTSAVRRGKAPQPTPHAPHGRRADTRPLRPLRPLPPPLHATTRPLPVRGGAAGAPLARVAQVGDLHRITPSAYFEAGDSILHELSYHQASPISPASPPRPVPARPSRPPPAPRRLASAVVLQRAPALALLALLACAH